MSDSNGVHGGHGVFGTGERVEVHANVPGGRGKRQVYLVIKGVLFLFFFLKKRIRW